MDIEITAEQLEPLLAQTQCTECGFDGCAPYAEALAAGAAEINLCRPGGERVMKSLAKALQREEVAPAKFPKVQLAVIDADKCIGCTLCIQACPTDAIIGAPKQLHDVLAADCTGCALCVPACPVDCISFVSDGATPDSAARAAEVKNLVEGRRVRLAQKLASGVPEATLSGAIDDIDYSQSENVALKISPEMQAKLDAARAAAKQKWTTKKTPATPRVLRGEG